MAEVVVDPDCSSRGIGSALIRAGLAEGGDGTRIWSHGNARSPRRRPHLRLGLQALRELLQMRRSLRDVPASGTPDGVRIRTYAGPADDAELLRVNNAAFDWHPEQGGWTEAEIDERRAESWFDPDGLFLAFDEDPPTVRYLASTGPRFTVRVSARCTWWASIRRRRAAGSGDC